MADTEWCKAVRTIAHRLFPKGFDVSDDAPNTYLDLAVHVARTGRYCVYSGGTDDPAFDSDATWQAFRAWHDWCHIQGGHGFDLTGECNTVRLQGAMVASLYGPMGLARWRPILRRQIIAYNFGEEAFCPTTFTGV